MRNVLPDVLQPWQATLSTLAHDVALSLGPWIASLAPAIGPLRTLTATGEGDPDGYDGLTRRGPYERLLLSEWLMADEVPEEFLRRAAAREHAFHQLVRRDPARTRTSVVLFDAGPSQLGLPRLAHLALLVVFAQRAESVGARFGWATLQRMPDEASTAGAALRMGLTRANVDALFSERQALPPCDHDVEQWCRFEERSGPWDDLWIVGSDTTLARWRARGPRRNGGSVAVQTATDPKLRALIARVESRTTLRTVMLPLPGDEACVRVLRASVARADHPVLRTSRLHATPASNLVFSSNGTKVAMRTSNGAIMTVGIPVSTKQGTPRPRTVQPFGIARLVGVGWCGRELVVLAIEGGKKLKLYDRGGGHFPYKQAHRAAPSALIETLLESRHCAALYFYREPHTQRVHALVCDDHGRLWHLDPTNTVLMADRVVAVATNVNGVHITRLHGHTPVAHDGTAQVPLIEHAACEQGFFCGRFYEVPWLAYRQGDGAWLWESRSVDHRTHEPKQHTVLGCTERLSDRGPTLLSLSPDGRSFVVNDTHHEKVIHVAHQSVLSASTDRSGTRLVYFTSSGDLVLYNLVSREPIARFDQQATP